MIVVLLVLLFGLFIAISVAIVSGKREREEKIQNEKEITRKLIASTSDMSKHIYSSGNSKSGIAIDEENKLIFVIDNPLSDCKTYKFQDVISSEILEDGETITETSSSRNIGGAVVGGLVAGGVGAIIGGTAGKTKSKTSDIITSVDLKLVVNDIANPVYIFNYLSKSPSLKVSRTSNDYKDAIKNVTHWHNLLNVIIKRNDSDLSKITENLSVADELFKLAELKDRGIITEVEFEAQKDRLLAK